MDPDWLTRTPVKGRQTLTLQTKMQVLAEFDSGEKVVNISRKSSLPESTVRTIIKNKQRILDAVKNDALLSSSTIGDRYGIIKMESILRKWCNEQKSNGVTLTQSQISGKARKIFESLKLKGKTGINEKFTASKGWFSNFKRRSGWNPTPDSLMTLSGCDDVEAVGTNPASIVDKLRQIIEEGSYTPQTVFNVAKTVLRWKKMPDGCYDGRLSKSLQWMDRVTIMIGGNAAGDFKLKPVLVYRNENPRALQGKCKGGLPVIWKSNASACLTTSIFEDWFGSNFIPEVERYCSSSDIPFKVMLIMKNEPGQPLGNLIDFDHRVKVIFLPPDLTDYCINPMCQEIVPIFKAQYTRRLFVYLNDFLRQHTTSTIEEAWKRYNILDAIRIIVDSWVDISENDWKKAWEKLFPSPDSNENYSIDLISERDTEVIEDIVNLAAELDMKISSKDVSGLLNSHNDELNAEEFAQMQKQNAAEEFETLDPLAEPNMTINKLTEALGHIKMGLQILQDIDPNEQRARNTMQELANILRPYEEILCTKIQSMATSNVDVKMEPSISQL